jgi:hypothetical protein
LSLVPCSRRGNESLTFRSRFETRYLVCYSVQENSTCSARQKAFGARVGMTAFVIALPENIPKRFVSRMQIRITRNDTPAKRPPFSGFDELRAHRILNDVIAVRCETPLLAFATPQYMIMGLWLISVRSEQGFGVPPKEGHTVSLITVHAQVHPDQVHVIGHQAVTRAKKVFAHARMQEQFAKLEVEVIVKPPLAMLCDRQRPMNNGIALVKFRAQTRQVVHRAKKTLNREKRKVGNRSLTY